MNIRCWLQTSVPGLRRADHSQTCLRCQAASARSRSLARDLKALSEDLIPAPVGLADAVAERLGQQDSLVPRRVLVLQRIARQVAATAVAAATTAAVATGVIRWRSRPLT